MIITFEKNKEDFYLEKKEYLNSINMKLKLKNVVKRFYLHFSCTIIFVIWLLICIKYKLNFKSFLVAAIIAIICKYVFKRFRDNLVNAELKSTYYLGQYKIMLSEDGVSVIKDSGEVFYNWNNIRAVTETKNFMFLTTNYKGYISIPKDFIIGDTMEYIKSNMRKSNTK